ncbi:SIMPL domain-containing protein [Falsirhodobacter algicola]|uniref:DUF541 domain-containing protein n=1 Tax=Falsirhodobacter algicola TaxID=2692330 RepID=A0A8J8SK51_9RHOB|nr:SIMPL domain-containing protein [Falsirhodobacter algicola]QUS34992.1 DUF541 domain-containing protein [Falsirhodobacter algicola]
MTWLQAVALGTALMAPVAVMAEAPMITVTGQGEVRAVPDMATVTLGVTAQGATAAEAMATNSEQLQAVLDRLRAAGIEDRDLQTSGLSLSPDWQMAEGEARRIDGYTAANMLTVRVRAIDGLGAVLDAAIADGANRLDGVSFDLADPAPVQEEARRRAVADAMARAQLLTDAAGLRLGAVQSIAEGGQPSGPAPMYRMADAASVPVAAGEISRTAEVTMIFALEPAN